MTSLSDALAWVYALEPRGIRYELERVRAALALLGDPGRGLRVVHIAGTNGKGSVAAMVERGLRAAGLRTGLFTSPHLHRFAERIRISGRPIADERIVRGLADLRRRLDAPGAPALTFFEVTFLLALRAFRASRVDAVVLETGLGGRLDATNAVGDVVVSVITTLSLDHTDMLGPDITDVAREKAGIIRRATPLVCGVTDPVALAVVLEAAAELDAPVALLGRDVKALPDGLRPALAGDHQRTNAALAIATLETFARRTATAIGPEALASAVCDVRWPGRLELVRASRQRPDVLLDAAHNPEGANALAAYVRSLEALPSRTALVLGAQSTKDVTSILRVLEPIAEHRFYVPAPVRRGIDPRALAAIVGGDVHASVPDALAAAFRRVGRHGLVVVAGSIFVMGAARAHLLGVPTDPPIAM